MTSKIWRKVLTVLFSLVMTATLGAALAACSDDERPAAQAGPETGVYYYDTSDGDTYYITLSDIDKVSMQVMGESVTGSYVLADGVFAFVLGTEKEISATYEDKVVTLTYEGSVMRFLRAESYTLTFQTNGGSAVASAKVMNGKTAAKPADPVLADHAFVGWYTDPEFTTVFTFGATPVTQDTTLYARWSDKLTGAAEYIVDFDLGYDGAEALAPLSTVGGKLYGVSEPEREGFTFAGWWVSDFEDAQKLTYRYEESTVFKANTTLFALWNTEGGEKLAAPAARVEGNSVVWDPVGGVSAYEVKVTGPNDVTLVNQRTGATNVSVDFEGSAAGEYTITVRAISAVEANSSDTAVRAYNNKALARVSLFTVAQPSVLQFNAVEGATNYKVSVECGDPEHRHTLHDNGSSTWFDFSGCAMKEGGIAFTVTASAAGRASSVSETFYYNRQLGAVTAFYFDDETETLSWDAVANATDYEVSVTGGDAAYRFTTGGKTSVALGAYAASQLEVSVKPVTQGYNSPAAGVYAYAKTRLPAPSGLSVTGTLLTWTAVEGAQSYAVSVAGREYTSIAKPSFDLAEASLARDTDYDVCVRAVGAAGSVWSEALPVRAGSLSPEITYSSGTVTWHHVVGATGYTVSVNGGAAAQIETGTNTAAVTLTQEGENTITIGYTDELGAASSETITVYAYKVTFDTRGGTAGTAGVDLACYFANGDVITLPETTFEGYTLSGWYNVPGAAGVNGSKFHEGTRLSVAGSIVLYANWAPNSYSVTFDMGTSGATMEEERGTVVYKSDYTLAVPTHEDTSLVFVGWFTEDEGEGTQFTDSEGNSLVPWNRPGSMTLYPCYQQLFIFKSNSDGTYALKEYIYYRGDATKARVPETYNGQPVTIIEGYAFNLSSLRSIEIPDTIETVYYTSAFDGSDLLEEIVIYETGNAVNPAYSSHEGVLYFDNEVTGAGKELAYVPAGLRGHYTIPEGVSSIGIQSFADSCLTSITVPSSVTHIGAMAFVGGYEWWPEGNKYLEEIYFSLDEGEELTVGEAAFYDCTALTTLTIPARFKTFSPDVFTYEDPYMEEVTTSTSLATINVAADHEVYSSVDGMLTDKSRTTLLYCPPGRRGALRIPTGITTISEGALEGCGYLTSVTIPNFVTSIGKDAFKGCPRLTTVIFAGGNALGSALTVEESAFADCSRLRSFTFQNNSNVVSLGAKALENCEVLTSITLPATLVTLGNGAFAGCSMLTNIAVDENNNYFSSADSVLFSKDGTRLMYYSTNLPATSYEVPESVKIIDYAVFANNVALETVTIGSNVEEIGERAFYGCDNLESVTFKSGTANLTIGASAFERCTSLTALYVDDGTAAQTTEGEGSQTSSEPAASSVMPARLTSIGAYAFAYTSLGNTTFGAGLTEIGDYAFAYLSGNSMTAVEIPAAVKSIGKYAFADVETLTTVTFAPNCTITTIGESAFEGASLTSFAVPKSVTEIEYMAFAFNPLDVGFSFDQGRTEALWLGGELFRGTNLTSVTFPENVTGFYVDVTYEVSGYTFFTTTVAGATMLKTADNVPQHDVYAYQGGILYTKDSDGVIRSIYEAYLENMDYVIPNTVTLVGDRAFRGCEGCTVTFEAGGTEDLVLQDSVFNSSYVTKVVLPARLSELDFEGRIYTSGGGYMINGMFYNCPVLEEVIFTDTLEEPARLKVLPLNTFYENPNLVTVQLPGSLEEIEECAFDECPSVTGIVLGNKLTSIGASVFSRMTALESIIIPASVKTIGQGAFMQCTALSEVTFAPGSQIEIIGGYAFGMTALTTITLPATLAGSAYTTNDRGETVPNGELGSYMFNSCTFLASVDFENGCPLITSYGDEVFGECINYSIITFPTNIQSVGSWGSSGGSVKSIHIPASFDVETFKGFVPALSAVTEFSIDANNPYLECDGSGVVYTKAQADSTGADKVLLYYPATNKQTSYTVAADTDVIGDYAFCDNTSLQSITLPEGLREIGVRAFGVTNEARSTALTSIAIPASVTKIGEWAFYGADHLETVTFEQGSAITAIDNWAFRACTALTSITLPDTVKTLGNNVWDPSDPDQTAAVFYGCTALASITLPNALQYLESMTFGNCTSLKSVTVKSGSALQRVAPYAFYNAGITEVDFTNANVTSIEEYAFYNCPVTSLTLGTSSAVTIGSYAFANGSLTALTLPALVKSIGDYAFYGNKELAAVTVSTSSSLSGASMLESIGTGAFRGTALTSFDFENATSLTSIGKYAFYGTQLVSVSLPMHVKSIGNYAFYGNSSLTSLTLSEDIESIGEYAFARSAITELVVPGNNTEIGDHAFEHSASLTSLTLEDGVDSLGVSAFGFTALTEVTLPASIVSLDGNPFTGCALTVLTVNAADANILFENKAIFNEDKTLLYYTSADTTTFDLTNVTAIMPGAFAGTKITSINIPSTYTSIARDAFRGCTQLESVIIGKNITRIEDGAFEDCTALSTLTFEEGGTQVLSIGARAFKGCTKLTSLTLPDRLRNTSSYGAALGESAFENSGLETVTYEKNVAPGLNTSSYSRNSFSVGARVFKGCTALTTVEFSKYTSYNDNEDGGLVVGDEAFMNCTSLSSIQLVPGATAEQVTSAEDLPLLYSRSSFDVATGALGMYTFYGCTSLTSFIAPFGLFAFEDYCFARSGLTSFHLYYYEMEDFFEFVPVEYIISRYAFAECTALKTFVCEGNMGTVLNLDREDEDGNLIYESHPELGDHVFYGCTALESVKFADVFAIMDSAFEGCTSLKSADITFVAKNIWSELSDGIQLIAPNAFKGCSALTTLNIQGTLAAIQANAFAGCTSVNNFVLPSSVANIASTAFSGWTAEQTITVPFANAESVPGSYTVGWNGGATLAFRT